MANLPLYIDVAQRQLVAGPGSTSRAQLPRFFQGDEIAIDLFFLEPTGNLFAPYRYLALTDPGIRLAIGKVAPPTTGTFTITFDGNTFGPFGYNATPAEIMAELGSGVLVTGDYLTGWTLNFVLDLGGTDLPQITADAANLAPDSVPVIKTIRQGGSGIDEIQSLKFVQLAAAYSEDWTALHATGSATPSTVQNGNGSTLSEVQRVTFSRPPSGGSFYLSFATGNTSAIAWNASASDIAEAINALLGDESVTVTLIAGVSFDVIWAADDFTNHAQLTINTDALEWPHGFTGSLSLDTLGIDQLLADAAEVTDALLEIELTPDGGTPETVIHQPCTVVNDLIENSTYGSTPNPGATAASRDLVNPEYRDDVSGAVSLAALPTANGAIATGKMVQFHNDDDDGTLDTFLLFHDDIATLASLQPNHGVEPDDYHATTNPRWWALVERRDDRGANGLGSLTLPETAGLIEWGGTSYVRLSAAAGKSIAGSPLVLNLANLGDANATIGGGFRDLLLAVALTAARTYTLPAASAYPAGTPVRFADVIGTITGTNTATLARAGSDTINGLTSITFAAAYASCVLISDGTSKWTAVLPSIAGNRQTQVLSGAAASITFVVPAGYTNLRLTIAGRTSAAVDQASLLLRCNADTGSNYEWQEVYGYSGSPGGLESLTQSSIELGGIMGTSAAANYPGSAVADIPGYSGTTFFKTVTSMSYDRSTGKPTLRTYAGIWKNAGAITSITLFPSSGNFIAGTVATLVAE